MRVAEPGSGVTLPFDPQAEADLAGCAAASRYGAELAISRVRLDDLYDPACRRVLAVAASDQLSSVTAMFAVTCDFQDLVDNDDLVEGPYEARLAFSSFFAHVDLARLRSWCEDRPTVHDLAGTAAARVVEAAIRRRLMMAAAKLYRDAGTASRDELKQLVVVVRTALDLTEPTHA